MKYNEFLDKLLKEISNAEKTLEPRIHKIEKNNGEILDGLVISKEGNYASPIIYIQEYYEPNIKEHDFKQCLTQILNVYNEAALKINVPFSEISYWELIKDKIRPMLVNYDMNKQILLNLPYELYMDLAIIYYIDLSDTMKEYSSIKVTNKLMDLWGISESHLRQTALDNMMYYDYPVVEKLDGLVNKATYNSFIRKFDKAKEWMDSAYLVTNRKKFRGACSILCNEVIKKIANKHNKGVYILPGSIHEIVLIPYEECSEMEEFTKMFIKYYSAEIAPEEVLSDKVYYYHNSLIL